MLEDALIQLGRDDSQFGAQLKIGLIDDPGLADGVLSINHKSKKLGVRSATEYVATATCEMLRAWRAAIPFGPDASPFRGMRIAVEDASPDTCVAIVALGARLAGRSIPSDWVDCIYRWELGFLDGAREPESSFVALASALVHAAFNRERLRLRDGDVANTFVLRDAVSYARGLIDLKLDPANLPRVLPREADPALHDLHGRAHASLAREHDIYRRVVAGALKVELSLPIATTDRRTDVDGIFFSETELTGVMKLFLRTDSKAPLGRGYGLIGLHRPDLAGSGNDMTVSVDPSSSTTLKDLWILLEAREEEAWAAFASQSTGHGFARPRDCPRDGMASFLEDPPIAIPSNEPWWEGRPLYTLIAAPRAVEIDGERLLGTRLTWTDVKTVVWKLYAPIDACRFRRYDVPAEPPWHLMDPEAAWARSPLPGDKSGLYSVRLQLVSVSGEPARWSQALSSNLAAFVDVGRIDMEGIPDSEAYDVIESRGGIALVSERGIGLIEIATSGGFPMRELSRAATEVAITVECARTVADDMDNRIHNLVRKAIDTGAARDKREALKAIYAAKLRARETWSAAERFEQDMLVRRFRAHCETRWRAKERLATALSEVAELEAMVVSSSEVRANGMINAIALIGFPFTIFGNLLGGFILLNSGTHALEGFSWSTLGVYLLASALGIAVIGGLAKMADNRWRRIDDE
ncbi:hypothetical protein [Bradyrhizobium sp. SZCCHNRI20481]|uniref:hypothetical protein n=1 Tax=Bradyrhizobium sp. SZCCHNRI20481 TaxID=3057286 RepID=UPI002916B5EE|nr:hypothetical protein [Bradyrhizobium sp. SZCCHNRI20481]